MILLVQKSIILNQLCESVFDLQKDICFVAVISEKGRVLESKQRDSTIGCLDKTRYEMFFMEFALQHRMNHEFDSEFSNVRYALIEREKETFFSFPLDELQLMVVTKTCGYPISISKKILSIIDSYINKCNEVRIDKNELKIHGGLA